MKLWYGFYRDTVNNRLLFAAKLILRNGLPHVTDLHTELAVSMIAIKMTTDTQSYYHYKS